MVLHQHVVCEASGASWFISTGERASRANAKWWQLPYGGHKAYLFVSHFSHVHCTLDIPIFRHLETLYRIGVHDNAS